ncbi:TIGR04283 family arsenosugar biosynthesis glycosyltransferase [Tropicibacter sp. R15_0]|uniref:TIGR04283 family arsenosugar biosynthesis glycosyltransferase n=1 Tax=Tropicibacter sp. R15_0 TaxID=2821101 RepID=UPI001AD955EE|nr:TIGR04283 family arsenosugar biosynthesis glycosyltransferase [Tropicibacter sp. R15_0]MBO9465471.1 TIGR04283 family arsenosugar biosynthesis glycosyltransferase [Tropicibacter sp. R15_0]
MRAPISVIIPTLNAADRLPLCLAALGEGLSAGLIRELVISDGGSTDGSLRIAEAAGATIVTGEASRGGQLRRGAGVAEGAWLLFLHADTVLSEGWTSHISAALAHDGAYYGRLRFDASGVAPQVVAGWANLRSRAFGLPYGDQALLIDRQTYERLGGFADIPLMEDVVMARALKGGLMGLDFHAVTSAEKYQRQGWLKRGGRNLWTLARFLTGAKPEDLARAYRK